MPDSPFDVITLGRVGIDLYPEESGKALSEVTRFSRFLGGSPTNVAVAAARHGLRAAVITRTGSDPFAPFVHDELRRLDVDTRFVASVADARTTIAFCELHPPDHFPLYFVRDEVPPELHIRADELDLDTIRDCRLFWSTLTGMARASSFDAHVAAWEARRGRLCAVDLDYRPVYWDDARTAARAGMAAIEANSVVIANVDECAVVLGTDTADAAVDALLERGVEIAVVKRGPRGVLIASAEERCDVAPTPVDVVNGLGAGDAFGGALCAALLSGWGVEKAARFASAAGAIVAGRLECASAMPTTAEVFAAMEGTPER